MNIIGSLSLYSYLSFQNIVNANAKLLVHL